MDLVKIGKIISEARKNKGMTQRELANKLHISDKAISKWERGIGCPDISFLIPLSQILDISLYELLSGEKEEVEETLKNAIHYSNKELQRKKKEIKKKSFTLTFFIIIIGIIFGYKLVNLIIYNTPMVDEKDYKLLMDGYQVKDTIEVNTRKLKEDEYVMYAGVKFKNMFDGYEKSELDGTLWYILNDENNNEQSFIGVVESDTYLKKVLSFMEQLNEIDSFLYSLIYNLDPKSIMSGIDNDIELFNYMYLTKDYKPNLFTNVRKMKENYYEKMSTYTAFPTTQYITLIKGDLEGYILNIHNTMIQINIPRDDKNISILMSGFNKEVVVEFLNTLVIE